LSEQRVDKKNEMQSTRRSVELTAWIMNMSYVAARIDDASV